MKQPTELSAASEPLDTSAGTLEVPAKEAPGTEPASTQASALGAQKTTAGQIVLGVLGAIAFLYFARPVVLPIFLACVAGMALKPLIRWLSCCHIPPALSARRRALPPGGRRRDWFLSIGPPGVDVDE